MRVLIVEDDPVHRRMLEVLIGRLGYEALTATDGREAIQRLESEPVQLVVADWMMPELDGLALCQEIRRRFQERYVYFILVTSRDQQDDLIAGFEAGVDDYLVKHGREPIAGPILSSDPHFDPHGDDDDDHDEASEL